MAQSLEQKQATVKQICKKVQILEGLTDEQLESLVDAVEVVKYAAGRKVIEKGSKGNVFYMIMTGTLNVTEIGDEVRYRERTEDKRAPEKLLCAVR